ncbi:MAG: metalloprotease PmbA [Pseudomonadota bacterium]|nr:metalloprotease PmbA [Pseudomonadota bacterium]
MSDADIQQQENNLSGLVASVLYFAEKQGASDSEVSISNGTGLSLTVRKQDVETIEFHRDQSMSVTVYFGQRKGSASSSDLNQNSVEETIMKACSLAKYGAEDEFSGLADSDRMARECLDLDLYHPWGLNPQEAIELASVCEASALGFDKRINNSEGASVNSYEGISFYGNSHGFLAGYPESQHSLTCAVLAGAGGEMQRDYEYTVARDPADLDTADKIGKGAAEKTIRRLGASKLTTRISPVIYPAYLARGLFGHAVNALSGGALYRKASFLLDQLDKQIFPKNIKIDELPHLPKGISSAPFDNEGVATEDRELINQGVLKGYFLGSYYARKLGMESTGNAGGIHNLIVNHTGDSYKDLLQRMNTGFLVTELMGQGVNIVNGDYSRGATGFWIENGEIIRPVNEVTLAGNLREMYLDIISIANDLDHRGGIRTGSVLIDKMTVAGN